MKKNNLTILVVDDDPNDLMFVSLAFQTVGTVAKVHTASSGVEAIAYLMGGGKYSDRNLYEYPDLIVTDVKMPVVNGFDLLVYIKENAKTSFVRTVVLSGSSDVGDIEKAYGLGAISYHIKPSDPTALRRLIELWSDYSRLREYPSFENLGTSEKIGKGQYLKPKGNR